MKNILAAAALTAFCPIANSNGLITDASDLWWNQSESGWGVNVIHQNEVLFLTFFVYEPNTTPIWYVASNVSFSGLQGGAAVYSGTLYQTDGPWFGGAFDPAASGYRPAGSVTFTHSTVSSATLNYTVDGVHVTKQLTRQTWRANNISGTFIGALIGTYSGCGAPSSDGYREEGGVFTVVQNGSSVNIQVAGATTICNYSGQYTQAGRMGSLSGTVSCNNGVSGPFQAFEIEATPSGLTARGVASSNACANWSGRFGGVRRGG